MTEPIKPIDDELRKKLDNIVMAITNYGHQVIHEQHSQEKSYVYSAPDPLVITRIEAVPLLVKLIKAGRKAEILAHEQAAIDKTVAELLLYKIKLEALAYRHYQGSRWEPKVGDYYTIDRNDLEFFEIVEETDTEFFIEPRSPGHSGRSHFAKVGFTIKDFGVHRCRVLDYNKPNLSAALTTPKESEKK